MIIAASFGTDRGHPVMRDWLDHLDPDEQLRRRKFTAEFAPLHEVFRDHPLTQARDRVFHRTGIAPVTIRISDFFGVVHVGNPLCNVPTATSNPAHRGIGPERLAAVEPWHHSEFKLDGMPLFPLCTGYLEDANALVAKARDIAKRVHGDKPLSSPP